MVLACSEPGESRNRVRLRVPEQTQITLVLSRGGEVKWDLGLVEEDVERTMGAVQVSVEKYFYMTEECTHPESTA